MKVLSLLAVCLFITTSTWAYSPQCAIGPEYWCRDASTAKECGAVQHCQQTVWREQEMAQKSVTTHETAQMLCNVLVQASTELLTSGSINVNSIKDYLRRDCVKLPHQHNLVQQCEMAVDLYLSDILRHIQSGTEGAKICSIIQGHDTSNVVLPKPKPLGITPNQTCVLCEFVVHILQTFATANTSAQELAHILEQICREMPSVLRDECKAFIESYGVDLIALLVREFDPEKTCELLKLCPKPKNVAFLTKPNAQACGLCDYVSTYLGAGYPIENVCTHFSTDNNIKQQCEVLVHLYKPNFCSQLPLCFDDVVVQPLEQPIKPTDNSAECSLCKYVVGYIDNVIQNNKSEAAIEAALEKVCTILPEPLKDKCVQFVDAYGPLLAQLIAKYATPEQVCNALKLCHNGTEAFTIAEHIQPFKLGTIPCLLCKYVIGYVETSIGNNKSAAAIEAALDKVCNILPGTLKDNCTQFVHKYGPLIAILLAKNASAEQICDFIKVCNNGTQASLPHLLKETLHGEQFSVNSAECSLCKYVVSYVDSVIQNNKSEAAIEAALEKVCTILPASLKDKCNQFVVTYGPILAQLIAKYATPDQVCNALKLCHNGTQELTPVKLPLVKNFIKSSVNSIECSLCKYIVGYVDTVIQTNKSQAAIEAALEKVCTILPASLKDKCTQFVDAYGPVLAQLIAKYATPEQVCNALQICHNGTQKMTPLLGGLTQLLKPKQSTVNSVECSLCKYVVSYIDNVIQNNKSEAAIEAALEKVCTILPEPLKDKCVQFVDAYGPLLAQLIAKYATPEQVCNALKLCNNGTESIRPAITRSVDVRASLAKVPETLASAQCSLCKYVVNYVDAVVQTNKSEAAIEAALEKVCGILPAPLKTACDQFVDAYGPILAQLIAKYATADKVCNALKMCHNGTEVAPSISHDLVKAVKNVKDTAECTLCRYILSYVNLLIKSNTTAQELEKALEFVCSILPSSYHEKCSQFVDNYGPILAELIAELDDPNVVCQWLGLCTKVDKKFIQIPALKTNVQSLPCNLCEYVVNYVDAILQSNSTETKFEEVLDKACKVLPDKKIQLECRVLVHLYGADLIKLVVEYGDPKAVCQAIGMCDK